MKFDHIVVWANIPIKTMVNKCTNQEFQGNGEILMEWIFD